MMWIIKLCGVTVLFLISSFLLKESGSGASFPFSSLVVILIFTALTDKLSGIIGYLISLSKSASADAETALILKAGAIAVLTDLTGDLCRASGEDTVARYIEFAGRVEVVYISLPLIDEILNLSLSLL